MPAKRHLLQPSCPIQNLGWSPAEALDRWARGRNTADKQDRQAESDGPEICAASQRKVTATTSRATPSVLGHNTPGGSRRADDVVRGSPQESRRVLVVEKQVVLEHGVQRKHRVAQAIAQRIGSIDE